MERIEMIESVSPWHCPNPIGGDCLGCPFCEEIDILNNKVTCSYEKEEEKTDESNN